MNRNETILSIKETLKKLFAAEKEVKFADYTLSDGTKITCTDSEIAVGVEVYALDDLGNQTPLDNGEYVLSDGRTIEVMDNVVKEISMEESTEDESPVSDASVKMADGMAEMPADTDHLGQRVTDLEAQVEEILSIVKQMSEATTKTQEEMMSKVAEIASEPGDEKIVTGKVGYDEYSTKKISVRKNMSEIEELRALINHNHKRDNKMAL